MEYQLRLGNGGNVTAAGWRVTLCDPIRHVSYRSGEAGLLTKGELLYRVYLLCLLTLLSLGLLCSWNSLEAVTRFQKSSRSDTFS